MTLNSIEDALSFLDKLQGLNAAALVALSCLAVGYALRFIKAFPNQGIPVAVILWGGLAMLFIADPRASLMPARVWTGRNLFIGLTIGFLVWLVHKIALSRIENWIAKKFPDSGDTTFFSSKKSDSADLPKADTTPKTP